MNHLRILISLIAIVISFVIQTTFANSIMLNHIKPDFIILIVVSISILRNDVSGATFGLCIGLLKDIFFSHTLGFYAMLYMLLGYFSGKPFKYVYRDNYLIPMLLTFVGTVLFEATVYLLLFMGHHMNVFYFFFRIILPEAVYNSLLSLPVYFLVYYINKRLESYELKHIKRW